MNKWDKDFDSDYQKENERFDRLMEQQAVNLHKNELHGMEMRANYYLNRKIILLKVNDDWKKI